MKIKTMKTLLLTTVAALAFAMLVQCQLPPSAMRSGGTRTQETTSITEEESHHHSGRMTGGEGSVAHHDPSDDDSWFTMLIYSPIKTKRGKLYKFFTGPIITIIVFVIGAIILAVGLFGIFGSEGASSA